MQGHAKTSLAKEGGTAPGVCAERHWEKNWLGSGALFSYPPPPSQLPVVPIASCAMTALRYLTLLWPGLPWLWLRGSHAGLVLALAFAVAFDAAVVTTFIWPDLVELPITVAVWAGVAVIWLASTVSGAAAFPSPLAVPKAADVDPLYVKARDAYLSRDWIAAETRLRELLQVAPTDGEAQLLLATLLRRVGRLAEARDALEKLSASDSGARWQRAITAEREQIVACGRGTAESDEPATLPLPDGHSAERQHPSSRAAAA